MASRNKTKWSERTPAQKRMVVAALAVHVVLVGVAHRDLSHRPAEEIRGPKWVWRILTGLNTTFTVTYLLWGRHRKPALPSPA